MPESTIVTGLPGGGGVRASTPIAARHHSVGTSGSSKSSSEARDPVRRAEAERATRPERGNEPGCFGGGRVETELGRDGTAPGARDECLGTPSPGRSSTSVVRGCRGGGGGDDETVAAAAAETAGGTHWDCTPETALRWAN